MSTLRAANSYLYVAIDDQFYQVGSSDIPENGTLTPGTNATAKSVAEVLSALNSDLANKGYTNVVTSNTNFEVLQNSHFVQSRYGELGSVLVEVNIVVKCLTTCTGSQAICTLPSGKYLTTIATPPWFPSYDSAGIDITHSRGSLFQQGTLYIAGGIANEVYAMHFVYAPTSSL